MKKIKIDFLNLIKYLIVVITVGLVIGTVIIFGFLYYHFYLPTSQVESIFRLQNEVALDNIDIKLFNKVKQKIKDRLEKPMPAFETIENPFR